MSECKECKGRGWLIQTRVNFLVLERCDGCSRFSSDEAAARHIERQFEDKESMPGNAPEPSSPIKFGSLKEMGEHLLALEGAVERLDSIQVFSDGMKNWEDCDGPSVVCIMREPSRYRLKPAPVKPREWWAGTGGLKNPVGNYVMREKHEVLAKGYLGPPVRLIEWPEGAELPELPRGGGGAMNLLDELLAAQIVVLGISFIVWGFACALALFAMAFIVAVRNARRGIFDGGSCRAETVTDFLGGLLR